MLKLAAVALLCSRGLSFIDDSSALIQRAHEEHEADSPSHLPVCSQRDLDEYNAKLEDIRAERKAQREKEELKAKAETEAAEEATRDQAKAAQEKANSAQALATQRAEEFFQPMLDKLSMVAKYLEAECKPTGLLIVKSLLQKVFKGPLVARQTVIDTNKTVTEFLDRWDRELVVHAKTLLNLGFAELHEKALKAMKEFDPVIQAKMKEANDAHKLSHPWAAYMGAYVLPAAAIKVYPELEEVAKLVVTIPTGLAEQKAWVMKEVLPVLTKGLPSQCQQIFTVADSTSMQSLVKLGSLILACGASMGKGPAVADTSSQNPTQAANPVADTPLPVRECSTCQENYQQQITSPTDLNGCMLHCAPAVSCFKGVTDGCLHTLHPCLRCHTRKLAALDSCLGNNTHANMIGILGDLTKVMKTATVEKDTNAFADRLLDAIKF